MNPAVLSEALALVARAEANGNVGSVEDAAEWQRLNSELAGIIPTWYTELITTVPLVGLEFGWRSSEPEQDDDLLWLWWMDAGNVRCEMLEAYPGIPLLRVGYLCVAGCSHGTGDQYFIPTTEGDDPPLYNIYHDIGGEAEDILANGREEIAPSLSDFFRTAQVRAEPAL
jgi:hypothetical protein